MITTAKPPAATQASPAFDTTYIWMISVVAALGGLLFGWDWVVIGGAKPFFEPHFNLPRIAGQWNEHALARLPSGTAVGNRSASQVSLADQESGEACVVDGCTCEIDIVERSARKVHIREF